MIYFIKYSKINLIFDLKILLTYNILTIVYSSIQKYGITIYLSSSSTGGNTKTKEVRSLVEDKSRAVQQKVRVLERV